GARPGGRAPRRRGADVTSWREFARISGGVSRDHAPRGRHLLSAAPASPCMQTSYIGCLACTRTDVGCLRDYKSCRRLSPVVLGAFAVCPSLARVARSLRML